MRMVVIYKFIIWMIRGFFRGLARRIAGEESYIGKYWYFCRQSFVYPGVEVIIIYIFVPLVLAIMVLCAIAFCKESVSHPFIIFAICMASYFVFVASAGINLAWSRFIREYEEVFTKLRE